MRSLVIDEADLCLTDPVQKEAMGLLLKRMAEARETADAAWDEARADAGSALLRRFGADHPDLGARLNSKKKLSPAEARALQQEFLEVFPGWFAEDGSEERLETFPSDSAAVSALNFRRRGGQPARVARAAGAAEL